jgi:hypothetical protein
MDARGDPAGLNTLETGEGSGAAGGDNPQSLGDPPAARRAGGPPPTLTNPVGLMSTRPRGCSHGLSFARLRFLLSPEEGGFLGATPVNQA